MAQAEWFEGTAFLPFCFRPESLQKLRVFSATGLSDSFAILSHFSYNSRS
jgi:hypothetical protein